MSWNAKRYSNKRYFNYLKSLDTIRFEEDHMYDFDDYNPCETGDCPDCQFYEYDLTLTLNEIWASFLFGLLFKFGVKSAEEKMYYPYYR